MDSEQLSPGVGFHLTDSGQWEVKNIPPDVLTDAEVSGHLTIEGYRCTVFDTPSGEMWAQKGPGTVASAFSEGSGIMSTLASRVAARHLRSSAQTFEPRPGDRVSITPLGGGSFKAGGTLGGRPFAGTATAHQGGGLEFVPDQGQPDLDDGQYDTLADVIGEADPGWSASVASRAAARRAGDPDGWKRFKRRGNCNYGGLDGFSVRDEPWEEAKAVLSKAWNAGYRNLVIDDSVMLLEEPADPSGEFDPNIQVSSLEDALEQAHENWWAASEDETTSVASRVAARWFQAKGRKRDVTSLVKKIMERPGDDKKYEKEIAAYGKKVRKAIPRIEAAFEGLASGLGKVAEGLGEAAHDKVSAHHAEIVHDQFGKSVSTIQVAANALIRNLQKKADEWDPGGKPGKKD